MHCLLWRLKRRRIRKSSRTPWNNPICCLQPPTLMFPTSSFPIRGRDNYYFPNQRYESHCTMIILKQHHWSGRWWFEKALFIFAATKCIVWKIACAFPSANHIANYNQWSARTTMPVPCTKETYWWNALKVFEFKYKCARQRTSLKHSSIRIKCSHHS